MKELFLERMDKKINRTLEIPVVAISGGIDSCAVLHHVIKRYDSHIWTVTVSFGNALDETDKAQKVVDFYHTHHEIIKITKDEYIKSLPRILKRYPFPRYNVWPWLVIEKIQSRTLYVGEGGNELFGYADRSYLEGWAGQLVWVWPTWEVPCKVMNVALHAPLKELEASLIDYMKWLKPEMNYFKPPHKELMKYIYKGILPEFVLNQESTPPSTAFYEMMGENFEELQIRAAKAWLVGHGH
jgi:asparagine synthetase B (glutamine-hydrolysing)